MGAFYPWLVLLHVLGVVLFVAAHGVSMAMAFHIRGSRDTVTVIRLLEISLMATRGAYVGLLLLVIGGLGAASIAGVWLTPWVVGTTIIFIAAMIVMYAVAAPYYHGLREALAGNEAKGIRPLDDDALPGHLVTHRPEILTVIGWAAIVGAVALMVLRPT